MARFKVGDTIEAITSYNGFEKATILSIDDRFYHCKIMNGTATIPFKAEVNYQIKRDNHVRIKPKNKPRFPKS